MRTNYVGTYKAHVSGTNIYCDTNTRLAGGKPHNHVSPRAAHTCGVRTGIPEFRVVAMGDLCPMDGYGIPTYVDPYK